MRIVCQQTILMKYALFVIFEKKSGKIWNCRLLQIIGGALWVKVTFCSQKEQLLCKDIWYLMLHVYLNGDSSIECKYSSIQRRKCHQFCAGFL